VQAKVALYQEAGVPLIWVVDPDAQTVTVPALGQAPITLTVEDTLGGGEVLPDLQIEVAEIFA
jgi:Uma2 family endonuclease